MNIDFIFPTFINIFLFFLSIFFITKGHINNQTQKKKIDQTWKEISKCKNCGSTNYQLIHWYIESNSSYRDSTNYNNIQGVSHRTDHYEMQCLNCHNLMFKESISSTGETANTNDSTYESSPEIINNFYISGQIKDILKSKLCYGNNGTVFLVLGYGLLSIFVIIFLVVLATH